VTSKSDTAYAVVRVDGDLVALEPELGFKVVSVFTDESVALREVDRLNGLNAEKGAKYLVQQTRWTRDV